MLLYAAGTGSVAIVNALLDDFKVPMDQLTAPAACLDCDPVRRVSECRSSHGVGLETALMAASLSGQTDMVDLLCRRGADVNAQNEVCPSPVMSSSFTGVAMAAAAAASTSRL